MKNTRLLKLLGIVAIVFLLFFSIYESLRPGPGQTVKPAPQPDTITIPIQDGQVQAKDFTQKPVQQVQDTMIIDRTPDFDIAYFTKEQTFLITLESQPVQQARDKAEDAFLKDLNIGINDACKLNVSLTVPFDVDQNLSGKNFGLSFCPNSLRF